MAKCSFCGSPSVRNNVWDCGTYARDDGDTRLFFTSKKCVKRATKRNDRRDKKLEQQRSWEEAEAAANGEAAETKETEEA